MPAFARCLFLLWATSPLAAQTPEQGPAPRHVDQHGDPLPEGAIQRFGSLRLRHPQLTDFTVLADGKTIVTVGKDRTIRRWDLDTGRQTSLVRLSEQAIFGELLSADGNSVLADTEVGRNASKGVFNAATGRMIASFSIREMTSRVHDVASSPDGALIAVVGGNQHLILFNVKANQAKSVSLAEARTGAAEEQMRLAFSADGRRLAVGAVDGRLVVLDSGTGKELFARNSRSGMAAFFPSGDRLAILEEAQIGREWFTVLRVINAETGDVVFTVPGPTPISTSCRDLTVSPDSRWVAVTVSDETTVHDAGTGQVVRRILAGQQFSYGAACRYSRDGTKLILRSGPRLLVRNATDGSPAADEDSSAEFHRAVSSPDGRWLAMPNDIAGTMELWDARSARRIRMLSMRPEDTHQIAFVDDGRIIRAINRGGAILNWGTATGRTTAVPLRVGMPSLHSNWLTPDGQTVLTATTKKNDDGATLRVVASNAVSGRPRLVVAINQNDINNPHIRQPGDDYMLATTLRGDTQLIDLRTGKARGPFKGAVAGFSHDSRWLWVLSSIQKNDNVIEIREAASGEVISRPPATAFKDLTDDLHIRGRKAVFMDGRHLRLLDLATASQLGVWSLPQNSMGPKNIFPLQPAPMVFLDTNTVLTPFDDGTAMTWDLSAFPLKTLSKTHTEEDMAAWWGDLVGDSTTAYQAIWKLSETPSDILVPFLRQRLRPITVPNTAEWAKLIADLNDPAFRVRASAYRRLEQFGSGVSDRLSDKFRKPQSPEVREQLERLATRHAGTVLSPETLRFLRALVVLEEINTPAARRLVEELTHGVTTARETTAAITTLSRMPDAESWRR
ncbi:WD40 repeat domain-containing protein [Zavarzinella formosa]|uniref:WD40 repeat domain-containing protein n=1 Tax=Zavarzinella formosa TaxID=360055 RepID=UPI0002E07C40|nr:WD40 repeat domain-containing protein [Zavarzinella formosa]